MIVVGHRENDDCVHTHTHTSSTVVSRWLWTRTKQQHQKYIMYTYIGYKLVGEKKSNPSWKLCIWWISETRWIRIIYAYISRKYDEQIRQNQKHNAKLVPNRNIGGKILRVLCSARVRRLIRWYRKNLTSLVGKRVYNILHIRYAERVWSWNNVIERLRCRSSPRPQ